MPAWLTILLALGGSAIISSVVGFFIARFLRSVFEAKDLEKENKKKQEEADKAELERLRREEEKKEERQERYHDIKELLSPLEEQLTNIEKQLKATSDGTLASLRNDILYCYYKCCDKGYRNDYDYQNIHDLNDAYLALDGNSFIGDVMKRFDALPIKESVHSKLKG